jgi:uncharacterized protein with HEPN domain
LKPTVAERITHISDAIGHIRQFVEKHSFSSFEADLGTRLAVERLLEVISEASRHIPQEMKAAEAAENWRRLADLGNWLVMPITGRTRVCCGT